MGSPLGLAVKILRDLNHFLKNDTLVTYLQYISVNMQPTYKCPIPFLKKKTGATTGV